MSLHPQPVDDTADDMIGLDAILSAISKESHRLAEQCGTIQWSISAILDVVDHPDLGAEIHMLQDVDRIQQTLADIATILEVACDQAQDAPVRKGDISAAIRLESLRRRLGLSDDIADGSDPDEPSAITWL